VTRLFFYAVAAPRRHIDARKSKIGNRAAAIVMTAQRAGGSALSNRTGLIRIATIVEPGIGYDAGRS
jgi:hypothetical protein